VETIRRAAEAGELTRQRAELLIGFVMLESVRAPVESEHSTYYRRCRDLRRMGLLDPRGITAPARVQF
jgi:hypothetical protein